MNGESIWVDLRFIPNICVGNVTVDHGGWHLMYVQLGLFDAFAVIMRLSSGARRGHQCLRDGPWLVVISAWLKDHAVLNYLLHASMD